MRTTLKKAVQAYSGADIPGYREMPLILRLYNTATIAAFIVTMVAIFLALEPTP